MHLAWQSEQPTARPLLKRAAKPRNADKISVFFLIPSPSLKTRRIHQHISRNSRLMMVEGNNEGLEKEQTNGRGSSPGGGKERICAHAWGAAGIRERKESFLLAWWLSSGMPRVFLVRGRRQGERRGELETTGDLLPRTWRRSGRSWPGWGPRPAPITIARFGRRKKKSVSDLV